MHGALVIGTLLLSIAGWTLPADDRVRRPFPDIEGWKLSPPPGDSVYTPENLWDIIDGAAEVFLANGFVELRIGEYTDGRGIDVRVELYRHNSRANAFGIYSQERNPAYHFIEVGTQGYIEDKVLNFLCGIYYAKLSSHSSGAQGQEAMMMVARALETHLDQGSEWPAACALFPPDGKRQNTDTYVAENFLGYSALHSAYVAQYDGGYRLFAIECDRPENVHSMAEAYAKATGNQTGHVEEGATVEVRDPHNGSVFLRLLNRHLLGILGCRDREAADRNLARFQEHISHKTK